MPDTAWLIQSKPCDEAGLAAGHVDEDDDSAPGGLVKVRMGHKAMAGLDPAGSGRQEQGWMRTDDFIEVHAWSPRAGRGLKRFNRCQCPLSKLSVYQCPLFTITR